MEIKFTSHKVHYNSHLKVHCSVTLSTFTMLCPLKLAPPPPFPQLLTATHLLSVSADLSVLEFS